MSDAADAEFEQVDSLLASGLSHVLGAIFLAVLGVILASDWASWLQWLATGALVAVVVVVMFVWRRNAPLPSLPEPEPPFVQLTQSARAEWRRRSASRRR